MKNCRKKTSVLVEKNMPPCRHTLLRKGLSLRLIVFEASGGSFKEEVWNCQSVRAQDRGSCNNGLKLLKRSPKHTREGLLIE